MVDKKYIKLGAAALAVSALVIGLSVGITQSQKKKNVSAAAAKGATTPASESVALEDTCLPSGGSGGRNRRLVVPGTEEFANEVGSGKRQKLRSELMRDLAENDSIVMDMNVVPVDDTSAADGTSGVDDTSGGSGSGGGDDVGITANEPTYAPTASPPTYSPTASPTYSPTTEGTKSGKSGNKSGKSGTCDFVYDPCDPNTSPNAKSGKSGNKSGKSGNGGNKSGKSGGGNCACPGKSGKSGNKSGKSGDGGNKSGKSGNKSGKSGGDGGCPCSMPTLCPAVTSAPSVTPPACDCQALTFVVVGGVCARGCDEPTSMDDFATLKLCCDSTFGVGNECTARDQCPPAPTGTPTSTPTDQPSPTTCVCRDLDVFFFNGQCRRECGQTSGTAFPSFSACCTANFSTAPECLTSDECPTDAPTYAPTLPVPTYAPTLPLPTYSPTANPVVLANTPEPTSGSTPTVSTEATGPPTMTPREP